MWNNTILIIQIIQFYLFIYLFIHYSFCRVCINNLKVCGTLMQLCQNEINFLGYTWNLNDPQIFFHNLLSKNYWWKNTLSLSKLLICDEIETFPQKSPLEVWRWHHFSIFVDNIKTRCVVCLDHSPPPANYLKGKQREGSTLLKESHNNHFKLKARTFF